MAYQFIESRCDIAVAQELRAKPLHRAARFREANSRQRNRRFHVLGRIAMDAIENLSCRLQLNQNAGEALCQGIVNLARHSVSFFGNGGFACLLCKAGELQGQSCLLRQSLREFQFHRAELAKLREADDDCADCFVSENQRNAQQSLHALFAEVGLGCFIERFACSHFVPHGASAAKHGEGEQILARQSQSLAGEAMAGLRAADQVAVPEDKMQLGGFSIAIPQPES